MTQPSADQPAGLGPAGGTPAAAPATTAAGTAPAPAESTPGVQADTAPLQNPPELGEEVVLGPGAKGDINNPAARIRVDERTGKIIGEDTEEEKPE